jgi:hypothetical protein
MDASEELADFLFGLARRVVVVGVLMGDTLLGRGAEAPGFAGILILRVLVSDDILRGGLADAEGDFVRQELDGQESRKHDPGRQTHQEPPDLQWTRPQEGADPKGGDSLRLLRLTGQKVLPPAPV